ncbi:hypothetical protein [Mucilaginibacter sp. PAMB04168]|uniref:hypothetical protein n=1 Tax=Mucilaginibacter sp. PAMB04168 TaxID=3138567 RepID=UPI0031F601E7
MSHIFSRNEPIQKEDEENIFDRYYSYIEELNADLSEGPDSALICLNNALIIAERNLTDLIYAFDVPDKKRPTSDTSFMGA